jgi:hypothetical protein
MKFNKQFMILSLFILAACLTSCVDVGDLKEETYTIPLGEAKSVEMELKMGTGELGVRGGADSLMEGDFFYNVEEWKPEVSYHETGQRGILKIRQQKSSGMPVGKSENRWEVTLNDSVPLEIDLDFGVGDGTLDLRSLLLESLDVEMGVGELTIDLAGRREKDLRVNIDGGIGSATLFLPEEIGVRAEVQGGIGSVDAIGFHKDGKIYKNKAYGHTDVAIHIDIEAGIGSIELRLK